VKAVWTLAEALEFLRLVQGLVEPLGYHSGILGSVILRGQSENDLDVVLYPHRKSARDDRDRVRVVFEGSGMKMIADAVDVRRAWRKKGSDDTKYVEKWSYQCKTVDIFFLS
jgi:hypothetical protein